MAKVFGRRAQRAIDAWAGDLGLANDLGWLKASYDGSAPSRQGGIGLVTILLGVSLITAASSGQAALLLLGILALITGLVLRATAPPPPRSEWIFAYTGGVLQVSSDEPDPRAIPWAMLVREEATSGYWLRNVNLTTIRLTSSDGTEIRARSPVSDWSERDSSGTGALYSFPAISGLRTLVDRATTASRLHEALEECRSGSVELGGVLVSMEGIVWDDLDRQVHWRDIRFIRVSAYEIILHTTGLMAVERISLAGIADAKILALLVQELAKRLSIRQVGFRTRVPRRLA